jgi:hypothetical protein
MFGGDEGYKYCRVCGKRIPRATRIWRKKCAVCGHRTCPAHLNEERTCRRCGEEGPPGTIRAQAARLEEKLAHLRRLHDAQLIDDEAYGRGRQTLVDKFTDDG